MNPYGLGMLRKGAVTHLLAEPPDDASFDSPLEELLDASLGDPQKTTGNHRDSIWEIKTRWWFRAFSIFTPTWGNAPI